MKILELYSGIGGMHMAFQESGQAGTVQVAIEINPTCNTIYQHNFQTTKLLNLNLCGLTAEDIRRFDVDTILMSPPCQPFARNGNKLDVEDNRTDSFRHLLDILPELGCIQNILVENVKGFEDSKMRDLLVGILEKNSFVFQEFLLNPVQFGIPNSRLRYYCLATKHTERFTCQNVMETLPGNNSKATTIADILDHSIDANKYYLLSDDILRKRIKILDICFKDSTRTCCFTKAYGRFLKGTGSIFSELNQIEGRQILEQLKQIDSDTESYIGLARSLKLRYFTPKEISRLMNFPDTFSFPSSITDKQKYKVLGNSVNIFVVSELIKLLPK